MLTPYWPMYYVYCMRIRICILMAYWARVWQRMDGVLNAYFSLYQARVLLSVSLHVSVHVLSMVCFDMYHDCISLVLQRVLLTCIITRIMERVLCYVSSLVLWRIGQIPAPCTEIRAQYAIRKQNMPPQQQCLSVERRILIILV